MICDVSEDSSVRAGSYAMMTEGITNLPSCNIHSTDGMWHGEALEHRNCVCNAVPGIKNDACCPT